MYEKLYIAVRVKLFNYPKKEYIGTSDNEHSKKLLDISV